MSFSHLHTHTQYSLLDGSNKIDEYVERVKELGMTSCAITDHGNMFGVIDFYKKCREEGIRPVIGCEVYVAPGGRFEKDAGRKDEKYYHLILLAQNNQGYTNLMKLVSRGYTEGYYYKPRVDRELLEKYHEGLICSSACLAGEVSSRILEDRYEDAREAALWHEGVFGKGNYFLEMQDHGLSDQKKVNAGLMRLSKETGIDLIVTNDCHYTYAEDADPHDVLLCLQTGRRLSDTDRMRYEGGRYYVKSEEEMRGLFPYAPEAVERTAEIAQRCEVEIRFHEPKLPGYTLPEGYSSRDYLAMLCEEGFAKRYPDAADDVRERLRYEMSVIEEMGFVDYFLIVWDFIHFARKNGIMVGPGRGSAAGSVVSYCLEITDIDPIKFGLIFERFLNPERVSMPDIDVDFCVERRGEVIDYVNRKYGKTHVAQIVTFGTMAARGVIRDVGRVMDLPYGFVSSIAKMVPEGAKITLDEAMEKSQELSSMYSENKDVKSLIDMSKRLEGLPRHTSTHAAGVVISKAPMEEYVPLMTGDEGNIMTQFPKDTIEELGLLKMDFLGLRNLTVIQKASLMIRENRGEKVDIHSIPMDEKRVYELISSGRTGGVFQLESTGMRSFMKTLKPSRLEDIIAGIALYRPGPMKIIPDYINGKSNPDSIKYDTPLLRPILEETYGCIVYQEQVMQIVRELAGYSWGRSDLVRRAMSKKKADVMNRERGSFVEGCIKKGIDEPVANKIFDDMVDFAKYAFNKPHAAAYAVVAYQTAYLKVFYPVEYMAALLSSVSDNSKKVSEYIAETSNMGINVLAPNVNEGGSDFSVRGKEIIYGLSSIKAVGRNVTDEIEKERRERGPYRSLTDFCERLEGSGLNKKMTESLIFSGAMDCFGATRKQMFYVYQNIMDRVQEDRRYSMAGQSSLFDMMEDGEKSTYDVTYPDVGEFDKSVLLAEEKKALDHYISGHPLDDDSVMWESVITSKAADFYRDEDSGEYNIPDGEKVVIGGIVRDKTVKTTKRDDLMAFVTLEDKTGEVEVIVFPKVYEKAAGRTDQDSKIFVTGRAQVEEDGDAKVIADGIIPFGEIGKRVWIQVEDKDHFDKINDEIRNIAAGTEGNDTVTVFLKKEHRMKDVFPQTGVSDGVFSALKQRFGDENVKLSYKGLKNV